MHLIIDHRLCCCRLLLHLIMLCGVCKLKVHRNSICLLYAGRPLRCRAYILHHSTKRPQVVVVVTETGLPSRMSLDACCTVRLHCECLVHINLHQSKQLATVWSRDSTRASRCMVESQDKSSASSLSVARPTATSPLPPMVLVVVDRQETTIYPLTIYGAEHRVT